MNPTTELRKFGISDAVTRPFASDSAHELVEYLDLLPSEVREGFPLPLDGAVEHDQRAVLYYLAEDRLSVAPNDRESQLLRLNRSLASRGERAYLAIVKPGRLEVAPVRLGDVSPSWLEFDANSHEAINFYSNLVHGKIPGQESDDPDLVFDEMYKLLLAGADSIAHKIGRDNTLSLVGRALFFRFLCDRHVITENDRAKICESADVLRACFDNSENAYRTSKWLDDTFNGHFLPFRERGTREFFNDLNRSAIVFTNLKAIVRGLEPRGNSQYQHRFSWAAFDFAHVPVGLLSQVYEAFSWKWDPQNSEDTSVHYTPRNIAVTLVEEAFAALTDPHNAKVLDPACGAGVFLVLAFRRLYTERWRASGIRPDTKEIRKILETQLCGFDISESALRLTALSLYLTAIELDPNPIPPEKLKFKDLEGLVLFNHRADTDPDQGPVVGSIRPDIGNEFNEKFHLVLCNPPWSKIDDNDVVEGLDSASKDIVSSKDKELGEGYQNPRGEPDLPFVWKATQWCRPGGQIAMVLPARILFRQGDIASHARKSLFRLIRFTGIVNCSNIRKTKVWPDMDQPFMLAFAENEAPQDDSQFWFVSPQADFSLNRLGDLRIDAYSAHVLRSHDVLREPSLLKTLAIGTWLDAEVIRKVRNAPVTPFAQYWTKQLGLTSSKGYVVSNKCEPSDASLMHGLKDIGDAKDLACQFSVDADDCDAFTLAVLDRTRIRKDRVDPLEVYRGPLLLLKQSLPTDPEKGLAVICDDDIAYNQSFYGYSAKGHPQADLLVRYLQLFVHSRIWRHFLLCTSPKIATERPVFLKGDFDACPFVPLEQVPIDKHADIVQLSEQLANGSEATFSEIDTFFCQIYGLTKSDILVIEDTLVVRNPHDELGVCGSTAPKSQEIRNFISEVKKAIKPFAKRVSLNIEVAEHGDQSDKDAFRFLFVSTGEDGGLSIPALQKLILQLADQTGASMIIQEQDGNLLVGILNQYRYWTKSRARLLAADILRDHFAKLEELHTS